jgi:hypothetical protein
MVVEIDTKVVLECRFFFGITVYMALELGLTYDFLPAITVIQILCLYYSQQIWELNCHMKDMK